MLLEAKKRWLEFWETPQAEVVDMRLHGESLTRWIQAVNDRMIVTKQIPKERMTTGSKKDIVIEQVATDRLCPDPANLRRIADAELEALTRSIREFGFVDPVIARRSGRAE